MTLKGRTTKIMEGKILNWMKVNLVFESEAKLNSLIIRREVNMDARELKKGIDAAHERINSLEEALWDVTVFAAALRLILVKSGLIEASKLDSMQKLVRERMEEERREYFKEEYEKLMTVHEVEDFLRDIGDEE